MSERPRLDRWLVGPDGDEGTDPAPWWDSMRWSPDLADGEGQGPSDSVSFRVDSGTVQEALQAITDGFGTPTREAGQRRHARGGEDRLGT